MSRRGRGKPRYVVNNESAYPRNRNFGQHDNRDQDQTTGTEYHNNGSNRGSYRGRYNKRRGRGNYNKRGGGSPITRTIRQDDDGDVTMNDGPQRRFNPYQRPTRGQRGRGRGNFDARDKLGGGGRNQDRQYKEYKPRKTWSLVKILQGAQLEEQWVIEQLRAASMTAFTCYHYYREFNNSFFYVDNVVIADAIRDCSKKIETPDKEKLIITVRTQDHYFEITEEIMETIKTVLGNRFKHDTSTLDLSNIFNDSGFSKTRLRLNHGRDMQLVVNMIAQHLPDLSALDLSKNRMNALGTLQYLVPYTPNLKTLNLSHNMLEDFDSIRPVAGWDLSSLNMDNNPLCEKYHNSDDYTSALRDLFPKLMELDGQKLAAPAKFDVEKVTSLPKSKREYVPSQIRTMIEQFTKQYFEIFDTARAQLVAAYDPNCAFSMTVDPYARGPPLTRYMALSRNMLRVKTKNQRRSLLHHKHDDVMKALDKLPGTRHDIPALIVDVSFHSSQLIQFIVRGIFEEQPHVSKGKPSHAQKSTMRYFYRTFLCITDGSRLTIINDHLHIRNPRHAEITEAFKTPPTPPTNQSPAASPPQGNTTEQMVQQFMRDSGMNMPYSKQCLEANAWNYQLAGEKFMQLKTAGQIPAEAFT